MTKQFPLFFVFTLFCGSLARAEPADPLPTAPTTAGEPQKVEVRGEAYNARRDEVGTRIVVKREELTSFGTSSLTETLTRLPGITVTNTGALAMRGLAGGYVQILLNGEPLPVGFTLDTLAPELIDRVEILRASMADVGTQAIAGTINIVLKKESKNEQRELKVSAAVGHVLRETGANLQRTGAGRGWDYALGVSAVTRWSENDWDEDEIGRDAANAVDLRRYNLRRGDRRQQVVGVAPRLSYKLAGGGTVALQTFLNAEHIRRFSSSQSLTYLGVDPDHVTEHSHYDERNWVLRNDLSLRQKLSGDATLDLKVGQTTSRRNTDFDQIGYLGDGATNLDSTVFSRIREEGWNSTGKYTKSLFGNHTVAFGWDGRHTSRSENRIEQALAFVGVPALDTDQEYTGTISRLALYGQDEWSPGGGLSVYLGVRWETLQTRSQGNEFLPIRSRSSFFFPVMHAIWKIPGSTSSQVRAALTRTFNPPEVAKLIPRLYTSFNNSPVYPDRQGNPLLRPEIAIGLDAAYEHYWANKAMASVGIYVREIDDFIREDVALVQDRWLATNINAGKAHTRGIEFDAKTPLRSLLAGLPELDASVNLTRNWSSVDNVPGPDNRLSQQTRVSGTAALDYHSAERAVTAGGSFRFKTGGPLRVAYNEREYSSATRELDLYTSWKISPKTQVRLAWLNVLHQPGWISYGYLGPSSRLDLLQMRPTWASVRVNLEHQL